MIADAYKRATWAPPNIDSYNHLLAGMVKALKKPEDEKNIVSEVTMFEGDCGQIREEMLRFGLRPNAVTHKHMVEAFVKLGDVDLAIGSIESMQASNGSVQLISRKALTGLLLMLVKNDRPVDVLKIMRQMVQDNLRLPKNATLPLAGAGDRTLVSAWLDAHLDQMRKNKGKSMEDTAHLDMMEARRVEVMDNGIKVSSGGARCVVDDDGLFIPPTKMTTEELQTECEINSDSYQGLTRTQIIRKVKARRAGLSEALLSAQTKLKDLVKKERKAAGLLVDDKRAGSKVGQDNFRLFKYEAGKMARVTNVVQEFLKATKEGYEKEVGGGGFDEEGDGEGERKRDGRNVTELEDMVGMQLDEGEDESLLSPHPHPHPQWPAESLPSPDPLILPLTHPSDLVLSFPSSNNPKRC